MVGQSNGSRRGRERQGQHRLLTRASQQGRGDRHGPTAVDPIVRLEQKLDHALRLITSLQQQLDSIDATLARALNRS